MTVDDRYECDEDRLGRIAGKDAERLEGLKARVRELEVENARLRGLRQFDDFVCNASLSDAEKMADNMIVMEAENANLTDALRLVIGNKNGVPWTDVPQKDVDGYVLAVAALKEMRQGKSA